MKILALVILLLGMMAASAQSTPSEPSRWRQQAQRVNIIRDVWGIPHIYGKTDADAVFGLMYAQCEDDFARVEMNYLEKLGRKAEVYGEPELYHDLYTRLVLDSAEAVADYRKSPPWLKKLLHAFADGINFYLHQHPETKPLLLTRFEPWFPLLWTDGSIGAINTADVTVADLKAFYTGQAYPIAQRTNAFFDEHTSGSNGFAIAPAKTASGKSILYINPHVTFYFRPEVHMVSEEGLNAYGAVTWGQFFVYQGFNEYCGWMHTSCHVDVADVYREKVTRVNDQLTYQYNNRQRPVTQTSITLRLADGSSKKFIAYRTHHGPIMAWRDNVHLSVKAVNRSLSGLYQSWLRTKAKGLSDFQKTMDYRSNASNNTVYADRAGNVAYWHGNFVPMRDRAYDWSRAVDGTLSSTEWKGLHPVSETVHVINPASGWIQNCNSTPFTVAGSSSPSKEKYPAYMAPDGENFRGVNAARVLSRGSGYTIETTIAAGYDRTLAAFEVLLPGLLKAYQGLTATDSLHRVLAEPMAVLQRWDYRVDEKSVATTLAVEWAQKLSSTLRKVYIEEGEDDQVQATKRFVQQATPADLLLPFYQTVQELHGKFGSWGMAWGDVNRFQRLSNHPDGEYDDAQPSFPVAFASSAWGMLPSYNSRPYPNTQKRYGVSGNSFVCAVEFGDRIKAKSLLAGGNSGHVHSPHFFDQGKMYATGAFKDVLFYREDVEKQAERTYRPGQR
ncbi:MAG: penicillin acylase family protein [Cyclobacteriaceae bacterium]|jgi:acyl-homoserine lactone acylase PvdQ|nr:penicillin acylase family protein [Cyclobacteriaceae bacterium]